jgi:hypothetical protein
VVIAGLLFWVAVRHLSYNSHLFFQLVVWAFALWGVYRAFTAEEGAQLLFYSVVAFIFFPASSFVFAKSTWKTIDIVLAILILLSILIVDSAPFHTLMKRPGAKPVQTLIAVVFAVAWVGLGCALIYYSAGRITKVVKLKLDRKEAQAQITYVTHVVHYTTDSDNNPESDDVYKTEYAFQTEDGQSITGSAEFLDNPVSDLIADDLLQQYSHFEVGKARAVPLSVEYQAGNPTNNRALNHREGFFSTIFGAISLACFSLWPVYSGFKSAHENLLEFLPEKQPQIPATKKSPIKQSRSG